MFLPVERSITVSAPQRIAHTSFSTSSSIERGDRRVADVGVDLHQEVAADRHRLELGVVDVRGQDGAAARHLVAHELRGDLLGDRGPEGLSRVSRLQLAQVLAGACAAQVLANRDELHLRGDHATARVGGPCATREGARW
jgi:hypothetical protein